MSYHDEGRHKDLAVEALILAAIGFVLFAVWKFIIQPLLGGEQS